MAGANMDTSEFSASVDRMKAAVTTDDMSRRVGTSVEYAPHVEYGTAPHVITGDPLAWETDSGDMAFATRVRHPGTPSQPHVRPGARATGPELARIAARSDSLEQFLDRAALAMEANIKRRTPVATGNLKGSYEVLG